MPARSRSRLARLSPLSLAAFLAAAAALPAAAQVQNFDVAPTNGLPLPLTGAATAEESTAMQVNPAGLGFVHGPSFQYFHVERIDEVGASGDGYYLGGLLGPFGPGFSQEWVRPVGARDYRITTLGLALSDGTSASFGMDWRWWLSGDPSLDAMHAFDFGLTLRPSRSLSIAGSALGYGAKLNGVAQPVRYDFGLGWRFPSNSITLSADYLADDDGRGAFRSTAIAAGLSVELPNGFGANAQLRFPLPDARPGQDELVGVVGLTWNQPHAGLTGGVAAADKDARWLVGVRSSLERYPAPPDQRLAPRIDVAKELRPLKFLFIELGGPDPYDTLLRKLESAREDGDVGALVLEVDDLPFGAGKVDELRASLLATRKVKPVLVYLTGGATKEYWLASAATRVAMIPSGTLMMNGIASSQLYLKDGLAKLGVVVEVARAGGYKTAPEPLTRSEPSPESREMTGSLLDDVFGRLTTQVAASRSLTPDKVKALVDQGLFSATEARAAGLIDDLLWPDELERWARQTGNSKLSLQDGYDPTPLRVARHWGQPPVIAIVPVEGAITGGMTRREPLGTGSMTGAASVVEQLERAAKDARVKAIVLRVDSPGGDAVASDLIWRAVM
jgi:protease-4